MNSWQKIYSTEKPFRAELIKNVLDEKKFSPVLINKKDSNYHFGNYEIYVTHEYVIPALKVITDEINFG